ncbi:MAG: SlyX family protein [Phycisphaerales bacterium]
MPTDPQDHEQLSRRVERLEELGMFADHRHDTLAATVEELSRQLAEMHKTIETLNKRIRDTERSIAPQDAPRAEDEIPPHNAF